MSEYKGYTIATTTMHTEPGKITDVGCSASKAGVLVYHRVLPGPFNLWRRVAAAGAVSPEGERH